MGRQPVNFTTRPDLTGSFGMVASTHWIASAVGMKLLEAGGNAFDAAAATGFVLNVVEPHLNGPLGDMPLIFRKAGDDVPVVLCGQGVAPARATIAHYRDQGLEQIPGSGLLATVVPGAFDAWMILLRDHGRMRLRDVLEPAITYARDGHPVLPRVSATIEGMKEFFKSEWPSSAATWLPGGDAPAPGSLFRNPELAAFWERLLSEAEEAKPRDAQIDRARDLFYRGFVAEKIEEFVNSHALMDGGGARRKGVLSAADMAGWQARYEQPLSADHAGWTIWKCGAWSQGPLLLQALGILRHAGIQHHDTHSADFVHLVTETLKLCMADRDCYFGDPDHGDIPLARLLADEYLAARAAGLGTAASAKFAPGQLGGYEDQVADVLRLAERGAEAAGQGGIGGGEPTMAHLRDRRGDTVHLDIVDRWGNVVSATPSGGWLQSSPVVPGLGVPLNTRAQMFWLEDGLPTSLAPGRRPRTTLSPSMARRPDGGFVALGTPGGDQQDQWQLTFLLRLIHGAMSMQQAIDGPLFHTGQLISSFHPRQVRRLALTIEPGFGEGVLRELAGRGHMLDVTEPWAIGRLTATSSGPGGILSAAATPRLMQAYAVGR